MAKIWEVYLADVQHTVLMYSTPCSSTLWSAQWASRVLEPSTPSQPPILNAFNHN